MSEWPYIIASYAVTWLVLGGFVVYLNTRNAAAKRALRRGMAEIEP